MEARQPLAELGAHARVEGAERLVEEEHLGLGGERARKAHALPLAAGELGRVALSETLELHEVKQLLDALADLRLRPLPHLQAERDVVVHGHVLEGRVVLEDEADAALLRRERGRVPSRDGDLAPSSGHSSPATIRRRVDFPEPLGPRSAVSEPLGTSSETSSTAAKSPKRFETLRTSIDITQPRSADLVSLWA